MGIYRYGTHVIAYYYNADGKRSKARSIIINDDNGEPSNPPEQYEPIIVEPNIKPKPPKEITESFVPAPTINVNPTTITTEVEVSVDVPKTADTIYIKLGRFSEYQKYSLPITVRQNMEVYAYYVTYDGYKSDVGYIVINNIKAGNKPYLRIDADPYPYSGRYGDESVEISIIAQDYDTLEYSENGVVYKQYIGTLTVTENKRIYARATNQYGVTERHIDITNIGGSTNPQIVMKKLDVSITVIPEPTISSERYNEAKIIIDYDSRATEKYYRIGKNGTLQVYTGEFVVSENTTIYAYAISSDGRGEASKKVDHLLSGISEPIIRVEPVEASSSGSGHQELTITIPGGARWLRYTGSTENSGSRLYEIIPIN